MVTALLLTGLLAAGGSETQGALPTPSGSVLTWGAELREWNVRTIRSRVLRPGPFGEGGCLTDLDKDGREEFVSVKGVLGSLLWIPLGGGRDEVIDDQVEMSDCVQAELFGRRGLLMIHRGAQVRFYERREPGGWISRDIYSIYTPSYQRGLALADVNGDGRTDIFCGNYWIRSPERFEESWRLFAIHTWFEEPDSAAVRIAVLSPHRIAVAEARVKPARFAIFESPKDPTQPWTASPIAHDLGRVRALALMDGKLVAGGDGGLMVDRQRISTAPVRGLAPLPDGSIFVIGPAGVQIVHQRPPRR